LNDTQSAAATAAIKTSVAVKSPPLGPLKIGAGKKGVTTGANNFGRTLAIKNRINGPISMPNLSQGDPRLSRFGAAASARILFI
jgi:hypothetical protein